MKLKNLKTGGESQVARAGVFVAIGHVPNTQIFKGLIDRDENGYVTNTRMATFNAMPEDSGSGHI